MSTFVVIVNKMQEGLLPVWPWIGFIPAHLRNSSGEQQVRQEVHPDLTPWITHPRLYTPGLGSLVLQWVLVLLHVVGVLVRSATGSPVSAPVLPVPLLLLLPVVVVPVVVLLVPGAVVGVSRVRPGSTPVVHVGQTPEVQPMVLLQPSASGSVTQSKGSPGCHITPGSVR